MIFPQANDLDKVFELVRKFKSSTQGELKDQLGLNSERQLKYYLDAAIFLSLLEKNGPKDFILTKSGKSVSETREVDRARETFGLAILRTRLMRDILVKTQPDFDSLATSHSFTALSPVTQNRRLSTVRAWSNWLIEFLNDEK